MSTSIWVRSKSSNDAKNSVRRTQGIRDKIEFLTVSDGSSADGTGSMSFGWKCVLSDGTPIAEASGPAYGSKATSYRSEGYGFTSATTFFVHLFRFCGVSPCWSLQFVCDNLGLICRINQLIRYSEHFPNITLQPDWDLIREIQMAIRALGRSSTSTHVKSHQDDHHDYEYLSLEARLNVDADSLAGRFRRNDSSVRPLIPRVGSNYAHLQIDGKTISGSSYRQSSSNSPCHVVCTTLLLHTSDILDMIDWDVHSASLRARPHRSVQLTKLCHELLPTATIRVDERQSPYCPRCLSPL
jgi:hypothetical protein